MGGSGVCRDEDVLSRKICAGVDVDDGHLCTRDDYLSEACCQYCHSLTGRLTV